MKRLFDFSAALLGLILLSPLLIAAAIAVRLDSPGPSFFRQERVGRGGPPFRILKFRTMTEGGSGPQITVGADRRITRVGAFLRRTKLDELPQLLNVVRGDMSLVGPRPEVPRYVACYSERDRRIVLSVRPGITDLASIRFHDESAVLAREADPERAYVEKILPRKLRLYRHYVRRQSLGYDLAIILKTLCVVAGKSR